MKIEKVESPNWIKYVIMDSDTGKPIKGEIRYTELSDAEARILVLKKGEPKSVERARDEDGHFVADDPNTPENEAYVGGKAPAKKKAAKKKPAKKKATKKKATKKKVAKK